MDTSPITARLLQKPYHIKGDDFERAYKEFMDFSESMRSIVEQSFPYATITIDRFHVLEHCCDAMQQLRVKYRRQAQRAEAKARKDVKLRNKRNAERRKKYLKRNGGKRKGNQGRKPDRRNKKYESKKLNHIRRFGWTVSEE